jgi:hypothetical protein
MCKKKKKKKNKVLHEARIDISNGLYFYLFILCLDISDSNNSIFFLEKKEKKVKHLIYI